MPETAGVRQRAWLEAQTDEHRLHAGVKGFSRTRSRKDFAFKNDDPESAGSRGDGCRGASRAAPDDHDVGVRFHVVTFND
jgi:hypothetical protein